MIALLLAGLSMAGSPGAGELGLFAGTSQRSAVDERIASVGDPGLPCVHYDGAARAGLRYTSRPLWWLGVEADGQVDGPRYGQQITKSCLVLGVVNDPGPLPGRRLWQAGLSAVYTPVAHHFSDGAVLRAGLSVGPRVLETKDESLAQPLRGRGSEPLRAVHVGIGGSVLAEWQSAGRLGLRLAWTLDGWREDLGQDSVALWRSGVLLGVSAQLGRPVAAVGTAAGGPTSRR